MAFGIIDALKEMGVDCDYRDTSFQIKCPFHGGGEELNPSCRVYPDTNSMHCFAECHRSWTPTQALAEFYGVSYKDATELVGQRGGAATGTRSQRTRVEPAIVEVYNTIALMPMAQRLGALNEIDPIIAEAASGVDGAITVRKLREWFAGRYPNLAARI